MQLFRRLNHLTDSPRHINYVFESRRSLSYVIVHSLSGSSRRPTLAVGYDFNIEHRLHPKARSSRWVTPSLLTVSSLLTALPLLWWLNSSNASISVETKAPVVTQVPVALHKKVNLSHASPKIVPCDKRKIGTHSENVAVHCQVNTSLPNALQQADLSNHLLEQLLQIFQWDINFDRDLQSGDQFSIVSDGEDGDILAAEFVNQGKVYRAVRYTDSTGATNYYTPTGFHMQKLSLFSAPLKYTRISSSFGRRKHPFSRKYQFHHGIDYAARWGAPIVAAGDGTVKSVGRKGSYGKVVTLEHHQRVSTLYAHMSKYAKGLRVGDKVIQGEIIGYVGQSGRATGPHLHYEIQLDGVAINPSSLVGSSLSLPIAKVHKFHFFNNSQLLITKLDSVSPSTMVAQSAAVK